MDLLKVGTEIYNAGDAENPCHFGKVVEVDPGGLFAPKYKIRINDSDYERMKDRGYKREYWVPAYMFSDEYKGDGLTRFVTREAYIKWRRQQLELMRKQHEEFMNSCRKRDKGA